MKIVEIRAAPVRHPEVLGGMPSSAAPTPVNDMSRLHTMSHDTAFEGQAERFEPPWSAAVCVATAEDGTFGVGMTTHSGPVVPLINDFFARMLIGEDALATQRMWNMMTRSANGPFGSSGMAAFAISAVDLALWDLKGKLLGYPVYELVGGPARERTRCYATGNNIEELRRRGFNAIKLLFPAGSGAATAGIREIERRIVDAREALGPDADLMLDCWMVLDASYTVRIGEALAPYRLTWIEDYAQPDDWLGFADVRQRLPNQMLAAGERWHTDRPFFHAASQRLVDVLQPDVQWVGGATAVLKIADIASAAGLELALHCGANDSYGQHLCHALPVNRWAEMYAGDVSADTPINAYRPTPGMVIPQNGWIVPSPAPGFGIELTLDQLNAATT